MIRKVLAVIAAIGMTLGIGLGMAQTAAASTSSQFCTAWTSNDTSSTVDFTYYTDGGGYARVRMNSGIEGSNHTIGLGIDYEFTMGSDDGVAWGVNGTTSANSKSVTAPSAANARLWRGGTYNHPYIIVRGGANGDGRAMCEMRYNL